MTRQFGHYVLQETVGRGATGVVHQAVDTRTNRTVALKLLAPDVADNREYRIRFQREARLAARVDEPHVIPIHDWGEIDGRLYLDMQLIDGVDLATLIARDGPLPPGRAVAIISQVAGALDAAHRDGLVHRDVKPSNILISGDPGSEFAWLIDFGIARALDSTQLTLGGAVLGTVAYMAPERFATLQHPGDADPAMDVYSLGCVLYEILTGEHPFAAGNMAQLIFAHLHTAPPRPSVQRPGVPAGLDAVIARGMAKNPTGRFRSAGALAHAARAAVPPSSRTDVLPLPPGDDRPARPATRRRRRAVVAVVGVATAAILLGGGAVAVATLPDEPCSRPGTPVPTGPLSVSASIPLAAPADLAVTPDGCHAYVSTDRSTVSVIDTRTRAVTGTVPVGDGAAGVTAAADNNRAYVANQATGQLSVIDTGAGTVVATVPLGAGATDVVAAPDGHRIYAVTRDGTVVVDTDRNQRVATFPGAGAGARTIGLTPDGRRAYVADDGAGTVSVIDTGAGTVVARIPVGNGPDGLAVSSDGDRAYVANHADGTVSVIDTTRNAVVGTTGAVTRPGAAVVLAVAPDRGRIYLAGEQLLSVIDTGSNTVVRTLAIPDGATGLAVSPDGRRVYLTSAATNSLSVIDTGVV